VVGEQDPGGPGVPDPGGADWHVRRRRGELRLHHGAGDHRPQYAALHLDSSYLRLTHGPASGWGTSLLLLPSFWSGGLLRQGAPITATWRTDGPDLLLAVTGTIGRLATAVGVRLLPPGRAGVTARVAARVTGAPRLDDRPGEAFKAVSLASMRVSATAWDASAAEIDGRRLAIPAHGWIGRPTAATRTLGLRGGTSAWKVDAPAIAVQLDRPLACLGWVSPSADPNDDNVGLWAGADAPLPAWRYTVTASAETPRPAPDQPGHPSDATDR
jgi:hypothetical protein